MTDSQFKHALPGEDYKGSMRFATNNEAEYHGLLNGLKLAQDRNITHLRVGMDSELVVKQMNGEYQVKAVNLKPLHSQCMKLRETFDNCSIHHIPRELNREADALANQGSQRNDQRSGNL